MKPALLLILLLGTLPCFSQHIRFQKSYPVPEGGTSGNSVVQRADGNYLIAAVSATRLISPDLGDYDISLHLADSAGNMIWEKIISTPVNREYPTHLFPTSDNGFLISGSDWDTDPYLIKVNAEGEVLWERVFETDAFGEAWSGGEATDGNYFFTEPHQGPDPYTTLFKISSSGDLLWTKTFSGVYCRAAISTSDGGFALAGTTTNPWAEEQQLVLLKIDAAGNLAWQQIKEGNEATSVTQLSDNGFVILGNYPSNNQHLPDRTYLLRTNALGATVWSRKYDYGIAHYLQVCPNEAGFVFSSTVPSSHPGSQGGQWQVNVSKVSATGDPLWTRIFPALTHRLGNNLAQTSDGGLVLTAGKQTAEYNTEIMLVKIDGVNPKPVVIEPVYPSYLLVYPNPALAEVNFAMQNPEPGKASNITGLRIMNSIGQEIVRKIDLNVGKYTVHLEHIADGMYYYFLTSDDGQVLSGKFAVN